MAPARPSVQEVAKIQDHEIFEMIRAERFVHGPKCEGGQSMRDILTFFRDRVLSRLRKECEVGQG